ncbi:hypothetical protein [Candidatus Hodarchaeum mangrovi]
MAYYERLISEVKSLFLSFKHTIFGVLVLIMLLVFSEYYTTPLPLLLYLIGLFLIALPEIGQNYLISIVNKYLVLDITESTNQRIILGYRLTGYLIILLNFLLSPPGAPPSFIIPHFASLDYYFILALWLSINLIILLNGILYYLFQRIRLALNQNV